MIRVNLEDPDLSEIDDDQKLYQFVKSKLSEDVMNYIFIDEVQNVPQFQKAINGLFIKKIAMCILPVRTPTFFRENLRHCCPADMWRYWKML